MNDLQYFDRVTIIQNPRAPKEDKSVIGCVGRFQEYGRTDMARVLLVNGNDWIVHPENLLHIVDCAVESCTFYANDMSDYCASHG